MPDFETWNAANWISFCSLVVSIGTAILLIRNFFLVRRQIRFSLALNQFNIFNNELKDFIEEAKLLEFKVPSKERKSGWVTEDDYKSSNGIKYIRLFVLISGAKGDLTPEQIDDFRDGVVFPLEKYYDKLYNYLLRVYRDKVLLDDYKRIIYNKVEMDILQSYFRICNNQFWSELHYDLASLETKMYKPRSFYRINDLYINNHLFQFKDASFYKETL